VFEGFRFDGEEQSEQMRVLRKTPPQSLNEELRVWPLESR